MIPQKGSRIWCPALIRDAYKRILFEPQFGTVSSWKRESGVRSSYYGRVVQATVSIDSALAVKVFSAALFPDRASCLRRCQALNKIWEPRLKNRKYAPQFLFQPGTPRSSKTASKKPKILNSRAC